MNARIATWFAGLTRRERVLVAVGGALAALVVLVYGIVLPAGRALDAAAVRHAQAVDRSGRLMAGMRALREGGGAAGGRQAGPLDQQVAASAAEAGFVLQSNQPRGNDATTIVVPAAPPPAALAWLGAMGDRGIGIASLTMTPSAGGTVAINATLQRVGP